MRVNRVTNIDTPALIVYSIRERLKKQKKQLITKIIGFATIMSWH